MSSQKIDISAVKSEKKKTNNSWLGVKNVTRRVLFWLLGRQSNFFYYKIPYGIQDGREVFTFFPHVSSQMYRNKMFSEPRGDATG